MGRGMFCKRPFSALKKAGQIRGFEWVSSENAIAPYDFHVEFDGTTSSFVEVKSTTGDFDRPIHISASELIAMRDNEPRHDIYRVFEIEESMARLRIAQGVRGVARDVLNVFPNLPEGIEVDSISLNPAILDFGPPIEIELPDEPEDE